MANLSFVQNTQAVINNMPKTFGILYYATDTAKTYYDNANSARVTLTNVIYVNAVADLTPLAPSRPRNNLYVVKTGGLFYIFNHNNVWQRVYTNYEIPSYLIPSDELLPITLEKNGISYAPRTMLKCVFNSNGESLEDLVNFKDASTTQRGTIILYDDYDSTDLNTSPTSNALNKLYKYITGTSFKASDSDKLDGRDSSKFLQYGDADNTSGYFDKSTTTAPTGTARLNYSGYLYATRVYNAVYNDYAELFERNVEETLEPGDVLEKDSVTGNYTKTTSVYSKKVVGVFSDEFGHLVGGNGNEDDDINFVPVGMCGRVHVKVIGEVEEGDLLTSSNIPGVAMKSTKYIPGTIIGKAVECKNTFDIGKVRMLIMNS